MVKIIIRHEASNLDNIPDELKALKQWVVWRIENNDPKQKVPKHAGTGESAGTNMPFTWSKFETAKDNFLNSRTGRYDGVGFVFTENDPYNGIDLDHVIDLETGEILPWAQAIVDQMDSYTEVSQSGTGIHIVVRGRMPDDQHKSKRKHSQVEIFDHTCYFALTGNILGGRGTIGDRQEQLDTLYAEIFGGGAISDSKPVSETDYDVSDLVFDRNAKPPSTKLKKALRSEKFRKTWEHKRTDLEDDSFSGYEASLASLAAGYGWDDQEIVNLMIAFIREHGDEGNLKKRLQRPDLAARVLALARGKDSSGGLQHLQSDIKEITLYGADEEGDFVIKTKDGRSINMGTVSSFVSPSQAYQRLYIAGYVLSPQEKKRWPQVVRNWRPSIKVVSTVTVLTQFKQWMLNDMVRSGTNPPIIRGKSLSDSLTKATENSYKGVGTCGYAVDEQGRLYVHIESILTSAQMKMGNRLSGKRIAGYLTMMDFEKAEDVRIRREGYHEVKCENRVTIWVSPAEFAPEGFYMGREDEIAASQADKELYLREDGSVPTREEPVQEKIQIRRDNT